MQKKNSALLPGIFCIRVFLVGVVGVFDAHGNRSWRAWAGMSAGRMDEKFFVGVVDSKKNRD